MNLIELVLEGIVTLLFAFLGSYLMWKWIGPKVLERTLRARMGPILIEWFLTPQYETGKMKKIRDDEGEESEVKEILSPLDLIIKQSGDILYQKLMGKMGGDVRKRQAVQGDIIDGLSNPDSPFAGLLNSVNPRLLERAIRDGDYTPIILEQLGPLISRYLEKKVDNVQSSTLPKF